jgi:hypothetical protein
MSLLEALLTEGYRDPREIYIALRADGQKGSGTIDDPYDGGKRLGPPLSGALTCNRFLFVVGTQFPHGLSVGNQVTITGAVGPGADWFNVTNAAIQEIVSPLHFTLLLNPAKTGTPPTNLPPAPPDVQYFFNGPEGIQITPPGASVPTQRVLIYWPVAKVGTTTPHDLPSFGAVRIENVSSTFAGDSVALGPDDSGLSFRYRLTALPTSDVTTSCTAAKIIHRYDEVLRSVPPYSVIHLGPGTFETRGHAPIYIASESDYTQLHVGHVFRPGQRLLGSGIGASVLKLVLPLDEINQTSAVANARHPQAPVGEVTDYAEVADLTVDCNAPGHAAPYRIFPAPVTCGGVNLAGSFMRASRVRVINYCTQGRAECFALYFFQNLSQPAVFNVIEDCIAEQPGANNTHETSVLGASSNAYGDGRSLIVRHNYVNGAYLKSDGSSVSSAFIAVESITQDPNNSERFVLVTKRPHGRTGPDANGITNNVLINGVTATDRLNGSFPVMQKDSDTRLVFEVIGGAGAGFNASAAYIGVDFHGPSALSGTGCVMEGNALYDCAQGLYTDTGSTRDAVVRDNYYSNVLRGVNFDFNPVGGGVEAPRLAQTGASLKQDASDPKVAIFESAQDHQLRVGDVVTISFARRSGIIVPDGQSYNDTASVLGVISNTKFKYGMKNDPGGDADDSTVLNPIFFQARYQVRRFIFENNVCELHAFDINSANISIVPRGMQTIALGGPPFMFPDAVVRGNFFRHVNDTQAVVGAYNSFLFAMRIGSFENTLIEDNLIGLTTPNLIHYTNGQAVSGFNNQTPDGTLLPVYSNFSGGVEPFYKLDSLEDKVSDALLVSLI